MNHLLFGIKYQLLVTDNNHINHNCLKKKKNINSVCVSSINKHAASFDFFLVFF